jgi:hypothetical protein
VFLGRIYLEPRLGFRLIHLKGLAHSIPNKAHPVYIQNIIGCFSFVAKNPKRDWNRLIFLDNDMDKLEDFFVETQEEANALCSALFVR